MSPENVSISSVEKNCLKKSRDIKTKVAIFNVYFLKIKNIFVLRLKMLKKFET